MIFYVAGHGHAFERNATFVKWMKKHKTNFLVSFAYPDEGRLKFARKIRRQRKKQKGKTK